MLNRFQHAIEIFINVVIRNAQKLHVIFFDLFLAYFVLLRRIAYKMSVTVNLDSKPQLGTIEIYHETCDSKLPSELVT